MPKLKKPDGFEVPAFTREEERYNSLDKTINKRTKFEDIIQNIMMTDMHIRMLDVYQEIYILTTLIMVSW